MNCKYDINKYALDGYGNIKTVPLFCGYGTTEPSTADSSVACELQNRQLLTNRQRLMVP